MVPEVAGRRLRRPLGQPLHRQQLRENGGGQSKVMKQVDAASPLRRDQQLAELLRDPLGTDDRDLPGHRLNRRRCCRLDGQFKARGDAHGPQHA